MENELENLVRATQKVDEPGKMESELENLVRATQEVDEPGKMENELENLVRAMQKVDEPGKMENELENLARATQEVDEPGKRENELENLVRAMQKVDEPGKMENELENLARAMQKVDEPGKMKKKTLGRRKIEKMEKIENLQARRVAFSKRRKGLFKKVDELCSLSGSKIAVIVQSQSGRFYTNGSSPCFDSIIDKFLLESSVSTGEETSSGQSNGSASVHESDQLNLKETIPFEIRAQKVSQPFLPLPLKKT